MITREEAFEKLKHVQDPHLHKGLIELNLIRDMMVREERISLTLVLTQSDEVIQSNLEQEIKQVLADYTKEVHIRSRAISDYEKSELDKRVNGNQSEGIKKPEEKPQHTHAAGIQSN